VLEEDLLEELAVEHGADNVVEDCSKRDIKKWEVRYDAWTSPLALLLPGICWAVSLWSRT
jgi:hypothetical protein